MNDFKHFRGRGRGQYQHNNYRGQNYNVRRANPNAFGALMPLPPHFRDNKHQHRWQRPPQHQHQHQPWRGRHQHPPPFMRGPPPGYPQNPLGGRAPRPQSPLPGSEEARQKAIAEASARIKQQLNLTESETIQSEPNLNRTEPNLIQTEPNLSQTEFSLFQTEQIAGSNFTSFSDDFVSNDFTEDIVIPEAPKQEKSVKKRAKKPSESAVSHASVEELRNKILNQFTTMSKGKITSLVNNPGCSKYDNYLQHLVRDMRLHLSSELRNMYNNRENDSNNSIIDHFNSIVPDLGVELVNLPDTMVAELSKILQFDVNNEIQDQNCQPNNTNTAVENSLVQPEDMFKEAEQLLLNTDYLETNFEPNDVQNLPNISPDSTGNFLQSSIQNEMQNDPFINSPFGNEQSHNLQIDPFINRSPLCNEPPPNFTYEHEVNFHPENGRQQNTLNPDLINKQRSFAFAPDQEQNLNVESTGDVLETTDMDIDDLIDENLAAIEQLNVEPVILEQNSASILDEIPLPDSNEISQFPETVKSPAMSREASPFSKKLLEANLPDSTNILEPNFDNRQSQSSSLSLPLFQAQSDSNSPPIAGKFEFRTLSLPSNSSNHATQSNSPFSSMRSETSDVLNTKTVDKPPAGNEGKIAEKFNFESIFSFKPKIDTITNVTSFLDDVVSLNICDSTKNDTQTSKNNKTKSEISRDMEKKKIEISQNLERKKIEISRPVEKKKIKINIDMDKNKVVASKNIQKSFPKQKFAKKNSPQPKKKEQPHNSPKNSRLSLDDRIKMMIQMQQTGNNSKKTAEEQKSQEQALEKLKQQQALEYRKQQELEKVAQLKSQQALEKLKQQQALEKQQELEKLKQQKSQQVLLEKLKQQQALENHKQQELEKLKQQKSQQVLLEKIKQQQALELIKQQQLQALEILKQQALENLKQQKSQQALESLKQQKTQQVLENLVQVISKSQMKKIRNKKQKPEEKKIKVKVQVGSKTKSHPHGYLNKYQEIISNMPPDPKPDSSKSDQQPIQPLNILIKQEKLDDDELPDNYNTQSTSQCRNIITEKEKNQTEQNTNIKTRSPPTKAALKDLPPLNLTPWIPAEEDSPKKHTENNDLNISKMVGYNEIPGVKIKRKETPTIKEQPAIETDEETTNEPQGTEKQNIIPEINEPTNEPTTITQTIENISSIADDEPNSVTKKELTDDLEQIFKKVEENIEQKDEKQSEDSQEIKITENVADTTVAEQTLTVENKIEEIQKAVNEPELDNQTQDLNEFTTQIETAKPLEPQTHTNQSEEHVKSVELSQTEVISEARSVELSPTEVISEARSVELSPTEVISVARSVELSPTEVISVARSVELKQTEVSVELNQSEVSVELNQSEVSVELNQSEVSVAKSVELNQTEVSVAKPDELNQTSEEQSPVLEHQSKDKDSTKKSKNDDKKYEKPHEKDRKSERSDSRNERDRQRHKSKEKDSRHKPQSDLKKSDDRKDKETKKPDNKSVKKLETEDLQTPSTSEASLSSVLTPVVVDIPSIALETSAQLSNNSNQQNILQRLIDIDLQIQKLMSEKFNLYQQLNLSSFNFNTLSFYSPVLPNQIFEEDEDKKTVEKNKKTEHSEPHADTHNHHHHHHHHSSSHHRTSHSRKVCKRSETPELKKLRKRKVSESSSAKTNENVPEFDSEAPLNKKGKLDKKPEPKTGKKCSKKAVDNVDTSKKVVEQEKEQKKIDEKLENVKEKQKIPEIIDVKPVEQPVEPVEIERPEKSPKKRRKKTNITPSTLSEELLDEPYKKYFVKIKKPEKKHDKPEPDTKVEASLAETEKKKPEIVEPPEKPKARRSRKCKHENLEDNGQKTNNNRDTPTIEEPTEDKQESNNNENKTEYKIKVKHETNEKLKLKIIKSDIKDTEEKPNYRKSRRLTEEEPPPPPPTKSTRRKRIKEEVDRSRSRSASKDPEPEEETSTSSVAKPKTSRTKKAKEERSRSASIDPEPEPEEETSITLPSVRLTKLKPKKNKEDDTKLEECSRSRSASKDPEPEEETSIIHNLPATKPKTTKKKKGKQEEIKYEESSRSRSASKDPEPEPEEETSIIIPNLLVSKSRSSRKKKDKVEERSRSTSIDPEPEPEPEEETAISLPTVLVTKLKPHIIKKTGKGEDIKFEERSRSRSASKDPEPEEETSIILPSLPIATSKTIKKKRAKQEETKFEERSRSRSASKDPEPQPEPEEESIIIPNLFVPKSKTSKKKKNKEDDIKFEERSRSRSASKDPEPEPEPEEESIIIPNLLIPKSKTSKKKKTKEEDTKFEERSRSRSASKDPEPQPEPEEESIIIPNLLVPKSKTSKKKKSKEEDIKFEERSRSRSASKDPEPEPEEETSIILHSIPVAKSKTTKKKRGKQAEKILEQTDTIKNNSDSEDEALITRKRRKLPEKEENTSLIEEKKSVAKRKRKEETESEQIIEPSKPVPEKLVKNCFVKLERIEINIEKPSNNEEEISDTEFHEIMDNIFDKYDSTNDSSQITDTKEAEPETVQLAVQPNEEIPEPNDKEREDEEDKEEEENTLEIDKLEEGVFCTGHHKSILDIKILGNDFLAASEDGIIYKYSLITGELHDAFTGHMRAVTCINVVHGSRVLDPTSTATLMYSGSLDCTLKCFDIDTAEVLDSVKVEQAIQCMDVAWGNIFLGTYEGLLFIYNIKKKLLNDTSLTIANATVLMIKATTEGSRQVLILASRKREIMVRDAFTGLLLRTMCEEQKPTIYSLLLDKSRVYCGTSDKGILILDFHNGSQTNVFNSGKGVVCMIMYKSLLFAGCYDGLIYVYNTKNNKHITTISGPGEGMLLSLAITDGLIIAGTKKDHLLKIWRIPQDIINQIE